MAHVGGELLNVKGTFMKERKNKKKKKQCKTFFSSNLWCTRGPEVTDNFEMRGLKAKAKVMEAVASVVLL